MATLSHELRTPLNAILGWAEVLRANKQSEQTVTRALDIIARSAHTQSQMVEEVLDMSRIITGKFRLDMTEVDLRAMIKNVVDSFRPAAIAKNLRLQATFDKVAGGKVSGDATRLQQIVWNIISNAVKFTPKNGMVKIHLTEQNSSAVITIKDPGQGIASEFLPFVFDRFRQDDGSTTRRHGGLGLGMAIVKHLVELHGGTISVESKGKRKGATFTVSLPQHNRTEMVANETSRRTNSAEIERDDPFINEHQLANLHLLIVDNDEDALEFLTLLLTHHGAKVTDATTVGEALDKLKRQKYDLLVSDIAMPDEDGFDLIRKVRATKRGRNASIPAVALSAYGSVKDQDKSLAAGFQLHISKPFDPGEFIARLAELAAARTRQRKEAV